ncbi:M20 metallopeptidase family protein [Alkalicoccus halolimnae]|uniref:M20 family metallopeptidase n=1 Tax=Alkalicoccus halolimnae TaxID=1667239 RepID=A0A5C7FHZ8_9BACI|nr:M20 family metallopeptidase [Alkalicoccus halolimnae]TXF85914.1 amidohydrolase [Alkalicoccus halolimnae]
MFIGHGKDVEDEVRTIRRELHENPELSNEEGRTSELIQKILKEEGIDYRTGYAVNGVLGIIEGEKPGRTIALRADIDALPIVEQNDHAFVSKKEGVMHACGHDAHTAMLLGAAKLLNREKKELHGTILLVFQPAEENAPEGGSDRMLEEGIFSEWVPDEIYAQHVWPDLPVGTFGVREGAMMGNSDRFTIRIKGSSGHASMPHQTTDAIVIAAQTINAVQTLVSRSTDPLSSAVVTMGKIEGGSRYNVIAEEVVLDGTVRTYENDVKEMIKKKLNHIVVQTAEMLGGSAELDYLDGYPATVNETECARFMKEVIRGAYGEEAQPEVAPSMGGEDFGRFLQQYKGVYYWLGTAIPSREVQKPLHDPKFDIDERALAYGTEMLAELAYQAAKRGESD